MAEKPKPSAWDRWNWNPIVPGLLLAWWLYRLNKRGWDWNWVSISAIVIMVIWFILGVANWLTGGKVVEWMNSEDGDDFEVPEDFAAFQKSERHESPLITALSRGLEPGGDLEKQLSDCEVEEDWAPQT